VDLLGVVSHRFPLEKAPEAFAMNAAYQDRVIKVMIEI
jgi:threonine dehydrogenase-like Zn-dependent dehydrogenase